MTDRGIIYLAVGANYVTEAEASFRRVHALMPQLPATLFTDQPGESALFENVVRIEHPAHNYGDRIPVLQAAPYARTLMLDTDTYLIDDISDVFDLLDHFDLALAHAPHRFYAGWDGWQRVPYAFTNLNAGLIALRKSPLIDAMLIEWRRLYDDFFAVMGKPNDNDQPALREALYHSTARVAVLPTEYNFRTPYGGYCHGRVKLLHGRHPKLAEFAAMINQSEGRRFVSVNGDRLVMQIDRLTPERFYRPSLARGWTRIKGGVRRVWKAPLR